MKIVQDSIGGWMWYVSEWKRSHPDVVPQYKIMMQKYIRGEKPDV